MDELSLPVYLEGQMHERCDMIPPTRQIKKSSSPGIKTVLFMLQLLFVTAIFVIWFSSESLRESKSLWILLLCAFPSNFLTGIVPYDPVIIYFAKYYSPFYVVFVGVASTLLVEGINYSVLRLISNAKFMLKIHHKNFVYKIIELFYKAPFIALLIAGFLPIPFYPFRLLVVLARYPLIKYLLTVLLSRIPRMYLLVLLGHAMKIPDYLIILFYIAIVFISYISILIKFLIKRFSS